MAFFSEVKARLGLDVSPFEKGMAKASATAKNTTSEIGKGMAGIKGLIGFAAIAGGFRSALERAKELRDTAAETGTALDPAVQRAADLADNLERGQNALSDAGITTVAWLQRSVDYSVAFVSQMLGLVDGVDEGIKAIDEGRSKEAKAAQDAKKNADARKKEDADKKKRDEAEVAESVKAAAIYNKAQEVREQARKKTLSLDEKIAEAQAEIIKSEKDKNDEGKSSMQRLVAGLSLEEARADLADLQAEKTKQLSEITEATAKVREDSQEKALTIEEKILAAKKSVAKAEDATRPQPAKKSVAKAEDATRPQPAKKSVAKAEDANSDDEIKSAAAVLALEEARANLANLLGEQSKKQAEADEKRTDELKDQAKTLLDQKKTIEQTLAAQEKGKRASLEDITSGKRNVGGKTKADAKRLQALAKEEQRQIDAVSQAEDALATPTPSGEGQAAIDDAAAKAKQASSGASRADKQKELARRRDALAATQARKASLEKSLGGKVSDDFGKQQVEELKAVNTQLGKVNTALAPASIKSNK